MRIEIYSDVLCPWCYIGKRNIEAALAGYPQAAQIEIVWRSFELSPDEEPAPGLTAAEAMAEWMDPQAASTRIEHIKSSGAKAGVELNLEKSRPVNTFDAHRLIKLASDRGLAAEMLERLFRAYHTEAYNIADHVVLQQLGEEAGLEASEVRTVLGSNAYADTVVADRGLAKERSVSSIPAVSIDGAPPVSGVQPPDRLRKLLEQAWTHAGPRH